MAFESFDPRKAYRENLGTTWDVDKDNKLEYCFTVTVKDDTVYIPMYLTEEVKTENLPAFPYVEMEIPPGATTYEPHDITAATRKVETSIDFHFYFTDTDDIDVTAFAKKLKDKMHDLTRTNQSITTGIVFMNVTDDGMLKETDGRQVVFHYIVTLYCLYYDICT
jgi:hypothetical protein